MKPMTFAQRKAIEATWKKKLTETFPNLRLTDDAGIYAFARSDESGLRFAYVGQAEHLLTRLAQHCYEHKQHIDNSIHSRKLWSETNPHGWRIQTVHYCAEDRLDQEERWWIAKYAESGYQLYNKTAGGQDAGKVGIAPNVPSKGYRDGLKQGYENARRRIAPLFEKYLSAEIKGAPNKLKERALEKFAAFLSGEDQGEE